MIPMGVPMNSMHSWSGLDVQISKTVDDRVPFFLITGTDPHLIRLMRMRCLPAVSIVSYFTDQQGPGISLIGLRKFLLLDPVLVGENIYQSDLGRSGEDRISSITFAAAATLTRNVRNSSSEILFSIRASRADSMTNSAEAKFLRAA